MSGYCPGCGRADMAGITHVCPPVIFTQPRRNEPMPMYGIRDDFPLLFAKTAEYDMAERLGGCADPLLAEIDAALRELWDARRSLASSERSTSPFGLSALENSEWGPYSIGGPSERST